MPRVTRFSTCYALVVPSRAPQIITSGSAIDVVICTRKHRDLIPHERKGLLCPLLHPRLR